MAKKQKRLSELCVKFTCPITHYRKPAAFGWAIFCECCYDDEAARLNGAQNRLHICGSLGSRG